MTPDEMVAHLASMLGNVGDTLDSQALTELKLAQIQAERGPVLPWFLVQQTQDSTVAEQENLAFPTGFLRAVESGHLFITSTAGVKTRLRRKDYDYLQGKYSGSASGQPVYYAALGSQFYFFPTPDVAYTITFFAYTADDVLESGGAANLWSTYYPDLLMGIAGLRLTEHQKEHMARPRFEEMVASALRQLEQDETARENTNREDEFGGDVESSW